MIAIWGAVIGAVSGSRRTQAEGKSQRKFARDQSGSAYQRAMSDLRLAGLNPILAGQQPSASPTPSVPDPGRSLTQGGMNVESLKIAREGVTAKATMDRAAAENLKAQTLIRNEEVEGAKWDVQWKKRLNTMLEGVPHAPKFKSIMDTILGTTKSSAKALKSGMLPDVWSRPAKPKNKTGKPRIFGKLSSVPRGVKVRKIDRGDGIIYYKEIK